MKRIEWEDCEACPYSRTYSNGNRLVCAHRQVIFRQPYSESRTVERKGTPKECPIPNS